MKKIIIALIISTTFIISYKNYTYGLNNLNPIKLDYEFSDIDKFIDKNKLKYTYYARYLTSLENLKYTLDSYEEYKHLSLEELLKNLASLPDNIAMKIKINAANALNFETFFKLLSPKKTTLDGDLLREINKKYSSYSNFKKQFKNLALNSNDASWIFLECDAHGDLNLKTSNDFLCPVIFKHSIVICLNLSPEIYNDKEKYIDNFFNFINWNQVSENYSN